MSDRHFGRVRVVVGAQNGKYPHGNSLWIEGSQATTIVDPSLSIVSRRDEFAGRADLILLSHVHEDHVAGVHLFPHAAVHAHHADAIGLRSLDGLMQMYGYGEYESATREFVSNQFHYVARPDVREFSDRAQFDLGGTSVHVIHTPGHTRGHCVFLIEPEGVLFLGDIELSTFGPYYGDAWSDLGDFERSLDVVRALDAKVWVSFHHVGVIEDRGVFRERFERFAARIGDRERALLDYLGEPRTVAELVQRRFLYPPHASLPFIDAVEQRTIEQHLKRLCEQGRAELIDESRYRASAPDV